MKACNLFNLDLFKTDFEISGLTSEINCKFTTFFSVANPLILCAPPQIFIVAERTRSDLAISPTHQCRSKVRFIWWGQSRSPKARAARGVLGHAPPEDFEI